MSRDWPVSAEVSELGWRPSVPGTQTSRRRLWVAGAGVSQKQDEGDFASVGKTTKMFKQDLAASNRETVPAWEPNHCRSDVQRNYKWGKGS